ncbi:MAG: hypothetical protein KatS3mg056_1682 [Chloroflexus sp.]|nr:MAG: hypothetical protein KatS3mg056_1682 [Chloroflexus sp.]
MSRYLWQHDGGQCEHTGFWVVAFAQLAPTVKLRQLQRLLGNGELF